MKDAKGFLPTNRTNRNESGALGHANRLERAEGEFRCIMKQNGRLFFRPMGKSRHFREGLSETAGAALPDEFRSIMKQNGRRFFRPMSKSPHFREGLRKTAGAALSAGRILRSHQA